MSRSTLSYLAVGVVLVISLMGLRRLSFATDILEILPTGIPEVEALQVFREYFDDDHRVILLLQHDEEVFEEDVAEFTELLKKKLPNHARIQYRPRFEEDPESFAKSLARMWADSEPSTVREFTAQLQDPDKLKSLLEETKDKVALSLDQGEATMAAYDPLGFLNHPAMTQLQGNGFSYQSEDGTLWLVMITNPGLGVEYREHAKWVEEIREAANEWQQEGFSFALTGGPVFSSEIGAGMEKDMAGTMTMTSLIVGLLFLITQRSVAQLGVLGGILGLVFVITLGLAGWVFGTLNLVSVGFAAILLGLVIDYGVVIARESSGQSARVLRREMAPGILWAALTTAVVFGILMLSTFKGVQQLGGLILIGLVAGAIVCLWLMPIALQKFPQKKATQFLKPPFPKPKLALAFLAVLVVGASSVFVVNGPPEIDFDVGMVEPEVSEAARTLETIQELFPAWSKKNLSLIARGDNVEEVRASMKSAEAGIEKLKESGVITRSEWPVKVLPNLQARETNAEEWRAVSQKSEVILAAMESAGFNEKGRALDSLVLEALLETPDELDPFARMFYHPDGFFSGRIQLKEKVDEVNSEQVKILNENGVTVSGWAILRLLLLDRVRQDLYFLFIPATLVLLGALILVFRSWRDALLTAGVLVIVLLLVNALAAISGRPWNFLSSMAIPLIVGTGIDYSIHLIFALRRSDGDLAKVWNGVGKGIFFCGLSTVVGFGSLAFASNQTLQSMGLFCSVGVFLTMTLSVLVVPALWSFSHRRRPN